MVERQGPPAEGGDGALNHGGGLRLVGHVAEDPPIRTGPADSNAALLKINNDRGFKP